MKNLRERIKNEVKQLCVRANTIIRPDVFKFLKEARLKENSEMGKKCLDILIVNAEMAEKNRTPICQDTGIISVFIELPEKYPLPKNLENLVDEAIAEAYTENGFRTSTVDSPLINRKLRKNNSPGFITIIPRREDKLKITVMPKGAGSENASFFKMLNPTATTEEVISYLMNELEEKIPFSCPPVVVGIGAGGTFDKAPFLARKALLRNIGEHSRDAEVARLEREILKRINDSGIGPCALGGNVTCLWVAIEAAPSHMASLPVAVNLSCHALRSASSEIPLV